MNGMHDLLPDADLVLALEPEELAGYVLEFLNSLGPQQAPKLNRYSFSLLNKFMDYPENQRQEVIQAFMEGWAWLEREGLLIPKPGETGDWVAISRRGKSLKGHIDVEAYRKQSLLPRKLLHPQIAQKVWAEFLRGDYDTAVFQAFKEVEVAVRNEGGYAPTDLGVPLMRKAFDLKGGPLADKDAPEAEREAMSHLFAGAIGAYKNPASHRHVALSGEQAVELIVLASHLLSIVHSRPAKDNSSPS